MILLATSCSKNPQFSPNAVLCEHRILEYRVVLALASSPIPIIPILELGRQAGKGSRNMGRGKGEAKPGYLGVATYDLYRARLR